jgi:hypothetical protein
MNPLVYLLRFDFFALFELLDPPAQLKLGILPDRFDDFNLLLLDLEDLEDLLEISARIVGAEVGGTVGSHVGKPVGMTVGPFVLQLLLLFELFFELLSRLLDFLLPEGPDTNRIGGHVGASDIVGAGVLDLLLLLLVLLVLLVLVLLSLRTFSCLSITLSSPRKLRFNVLT